MLLAGRKLTATEAFNCGLITDVFPHDKFADEVQNKVQTMAKQGKHLDVLEESLGLDGGPKLLTLSTEDLKQSSGYKP